MRQLSPQWERGGRRGPSAGGAERCLQTRPQKRGQREGPTAAPRPVLSAARQRRSAGSRCGARRLRAAWVCVHRPRIRHLPSPLLRHPPPPITQRGELPPHASISHAAVCVRCCGDWDAAPSAPFPAGPCYDELVGSLYSSSIGASSRYNIFYSASFARLHSERSHHGDGNSTWGQNSRGVGAMGTSPRNVSPSASP